MLDFRAWKITTKLLLLMAVFVIGLLLFGQRAYDTLNTVKVNGPAYKQIIQSKDLVADILPPPEYIIEAYLTVLQMSDEPDPARLGALKAKLRELKNGPDGYEVRHQKWVAELPEGRTKQALINDSYRSAEEFFQIAEARFIPALDRGDRAAAKKLAHGLLEQKYQAHRTAIDEVVGLATKQVTRDEADTGALVTGRSLQMMVLGGIVIAVCLLLSGLIANSITRPLRNNVSQIFRVSSEFGTTTNQQERMAAQQAAAVNETTTTMEELGASSRLSAEQAEAASAGAREALTLANEGTMTVEQTLEGMTGLKERSAAIAEQILRLSEQTSQIGNITNLVSDLANQTNLLALNAAVEAARAGEHGRGFGVVASEIRKLADQSKKSAERINALVAEIQQATNATVMVTEEGTKTVQEGTRLAQKTGDAFNALANSIGSTFESVQQIALNAKQQAAAVNQVVDAMTSLNAGARETAAGISQTKSGLQKLNESAKELASQV